MHEFVCMRFEKETNGTVAGKLLGWRQVMRVIDLGTRLVSDLHTRGDKLGGHEHVLVGINTIKSTAFEICSSSIGRTGIRCKERLNTEFLEIAFGTNGWPVGIVETTHQLFKTSGIRLRQLPAAYESDVGIINHGSNKPLQVIIRNRHSILGEETYKVTSRLP